MTMAAGAAVSATASRASTGAVSSTDVAVVGAGVFGAWTAWHLARRGLAVRLLDAYGAGHARASSGGESRVIRLSYGGDALYSPMARESLAQWDALSARSPLPLLHRIGVLWFSPAGDPYMADSLAWLRANGIAHDAGNRDWLRRHYPQIAFREGESGFLERDTGALIAGRGVQSVVADSGLAVDKAAAAPPVRLRNGNYRVGEVEARHVVYACGPWLPALFPRELGGRIVPTRQEVYHFGAKAGDARFSPPSLPVWADFNGGDMVYGLPDLEGQGFKLAFDRHGAVVDPDTQDRRVSPEGVAAARGYLARRFPGLADAPYVHGRVCQYENSSNGDFLLDRLPGHDRVWLVGAGSGHGFKHGPAVGRRVADHIADAALAIEPRFALAAKAKTQARTVY
jgi:glycine/D-amino acid oxidase-like deaminating enzyme